MSISYDNNVPTDQLFDMLQKTSLYGRTVTEVDKMAILRRIYESQALRTTEPLLPLLFSFRNKPLTLQDYRPFSPLFKLDRPKTSLYIAGRQVGKSLSTAASTALQAVSIPFYNALLLTPLETQIRKYILNYINPLMTQSPASHLWYNQSTTHTLQQKSLPNGSNLIFSFASTSADRIRGTFADLIVCDETQDFNDEFLPIIGETITASKYAITQYTGTPKTMENTIQGLWEDSSQAEWFTQCSHCNRWNIPCKEYHVEEMIGPWHPHISEEKPAVICYKCGRPIFPRTGCWVHRYPERKSRFSGYHIPQIILPLHFADPEKWMTLLEKKDKLMGISPSIFYNEILGESVDTSVKLITLTELTAASILPWKNNPVTPAKEVYSRIHRHIYKVLAADWGGGGETGESCTALALAGMNRDGSIDIVWGKRFPTSQDHLGEAKECLHWIRSFGVNLFAHDYTGAGTVRETLLIQAGIPMDTIFPLQYVGPARQGIVTLKQDRLRRFYQLDKTRAFLYVISAIKTGLVKFFEYDGSYASTTSLTAAFLSLYEDKIHGSGGSDRYIIRRTHHKTDDFAQAVMMACATLWEKCNAWPNFAIPQPSLVDYLYDRDY